MSRDRNRCFKCNQPISRSDLQCPNCGLYEPWRKPPSRQAQIATLVLVSIAGLCIIILASYLLITYPVNQAGERNPAIKLALLIFGFLIMFLGFIGAVTVIKSPPLESQTSPEIPSQPEASGEK